MRPLPKVRKLLTRGKRVTTAMNVLLLLRVAVVNSLERNAETDLQPPLWKKKLNKIFYSNPLQIACKLA